MTQEEKAKAYDEAYKKVAIRFGSNVADKIFLKESEDEKIRKRIIHALHGDVLEMSEIKEALAWLEKQGNLMKALQISNAKIGELIEKNYYLKEQLEKQGNNNMGISEATKQKLEDNLNKALEKETPDSWNKFLDEQGEQKSIKEHNACEFCEDRYGCVNPCSMKLVEEEKPVDNVEPKFKVGDKIKFAKEPKYPAREIIAIQNDAYYFDEVVYLPFNRQDEWELVKQNPAWSEEDRDILFRTIDNLKFLRDTISIDPNYAINITDIEREITWLNSLNSQSTWKPRDEQLKAIKWVMDGDSPENWAVTLANLYNDLKKLREE